MKIPVSAQANSEYITILGAFTRLFSKRIWNHAKFLSSVIKEIKPSAHSPGGFLSHKDGLLLDGCFDHLLKSQCFGCSDDWVDLFATVGIVTG
jgi:hypothetical protein